MIEHTKTQLESKFTLKRSSLHKKNIKVHRKYPTLYDFSELHPRYLSLIPKKPTSHLTISLYTINKSQILAFKHLKRMQQVKSLDLKFTETEIPIVSNVLPYLTRLKTLRLSYSSQFEHSCAQPFIDLLYKLKRLQLTHLTIISVQFLIPQAVNRFNHALKKFKTLQHLVLGIGTGSYAFHLQLYPLFPTATAKMQTLKSLEFIYFSGHFQCESLQNFSELLGKQSRCLESLSLTLNLLELTDPAIISFAENIKKLVNLKRLKILLSTSYEVDYSVTYEGFYHLLDALESLKQLSRISFELEVRYGNSLFGFVKAIASLSNLKVIDICLKECPMTNLGSFIRMSRGIQQLNLSKQINQFYHFFDTKRFTVVTLDMPINSQSESHTKLYIKADNTKRGDDENTALVTESLAQLENIKEVIFEIREPIQIKPSSLFAVLKNIQNPQEISSFDLQLCNLKATLHEELIRVIHSQLKIFSNLKTLKILCWDPFNNTSVFYDTNAAILALDTIVRLLQNLEYLEFNFRDLNSVTNNELNLIGQVAVRLPKIKEINMSLIFCKKISDKGINLLLENLEKIPTLQNLQIDIGCCKQVTARGEIAIKQVINRIKARNNSVRSKN